MLIRKNTKAFKTILEIVHTCQARPDREKLIRLYITRAGQSIADRISVEGIEGEAALFYEMNYQAVLNNLQSSNHQLNQSDDIPGIYFFHSSANKVWEEAPFEFDEAVKKEFSSLPDLPVVRKKEKVEKFVLATPKSKKETRKPSKEKKASKKQAPPDETQQQPAYKLKHKIYFTDLDRIVYKHAGLSRKEVLDYYYKIAGYMLPFLKDRPIVLRMASEGKPVMYSTLEQLSEFREIPDWVSRGSGPSKSERLLKCNDIDHLMFYAGIGCVEFDAGHSKFRSLASPEYLIIAFDSPDGEMEKVIQVVLAAKGILGGLKLPSFVKTDGISGFHIYIPLDGKSDFEVSREVGGYICRLIHIKIPDLVSVKGLDDYSYGKVSLDYVINEERQGIVVPYSLVAGDHPIVATPLLWDEVNEDIRFESFNIKTIFERLELTGDPFATLFKKKVNADDLLQRLEENYSFLL